MANKKQMARAAEAARQAEKAKTEMRNKLIALVAVLLVAGVALFVVLGGGDKTESIQQTEPGEVIATDYIQIEVEGYGTITAELYGEVAPITVANFLKLVNEGFYDGLTFHRIIEGFMIQGGDPLGNGTGGSDEKIKGEFSANGWDNPLEHDRGVLSMARSSAYDSASSQFFIMHEDSPHLDGSYAAFGKVLTGIEIVDAICQNTPVTDGNGTVTKANQPVITSIKVIEKPE